MALFKDLKDLKEDLQYYESCVPVNNIGKWYISIRIIRLKNKIKRIKKDLAKRKKRSRS